LINWPCIIKFNNDPELLFIDNQAQWDTDADFHQGKFDESDHLIDASGYVYSLIHTSHDTVIPKLTDNTKTRDEILGLVKSHASHLDSCCVSKLYAPSIKEAYYLVKSINEN